MFLYYTLYYISYLCISSPGTSSPSRPKGTMLVMKPGFFMPLFLLLIWTASEKPSCFVFILNSNNPVQTNT